MSSTLTLNSVLEERSVAIGKLFLQYNFYLKKTFPCEQQSPSSPNIVTQLVNLGAVCHLGYIEH